MKRLAIALVGGIFFGLAPLVASYDFPNSNDKITFGTTAMPTAAGTWMAWVNANADLSIGGATHTIFDDKTDANNDFGCVSVVGFWACGWFTATTDYRVFTASSQPVSGVWLHVLFTWDDTANETKLYVNGSQVGSTVVTLVTHTTTAQKTIGSASDGSANTQANAKIAYAAIWNSVLSGADITALAAGGCPTSYAVGNRVNYWTLVGGSVTDQWGSDNGTVSGAASSGTNPTVCATSARPQIIGGGVF